MPAEEAEEWLVSRKASEISGKLLRPVEHNGLSGTPLSIQKGQAEVFWLIDEDGNSWVLKKFHTGRRPETAYLETVSSLLPQHDGFMCGTSREVLSSASLGKATGTYHSRKLSRWLDGTILMPQINGLDWASLADDLRDGMLTVDKAQRLAICRSLSELVLLLEQIDGAHRDLSSGNVFINMNDSSVSLIDFDSLYHPSLAMPKVTTCGTVGYAPPYAWQAGVLDAAATWTAGADRYALAILTVEFLILSEASPLSGEGGMFDQDELRTVSGKSIEIARKALSSEFSEAVRPFEGAISSSNFDDCPSPQDWLAVCSSVQVEPPRLIDVPAVEADYFERILRRQRPAEPLWPAPQLSDMPSFDIKMAPPSPSVPVSVVTLPSDPWEAES